MKRSQTFYAVVAANTSEQVFTPSFNDGQYQMNFYAVYFARYASQVLLTIYANGKPVASFDSDMMTTTDSRGHFTVNNLPNAKLTYSLTDKNGTGKASPGVAVTFFYEVASGTDGISG